jgi:DNA polymerase II small subunit/DNA polymerase delta subunit B
MVTKKNTTQSQVDVCKLKISCQDFKQELTDRIRKGEELLTRNVQNEKDYKELSFDYESWDGYNTELLEQRFNSPENKYVRSYNDAGAFRCFVLEESEDLIQTTKSFKTLIEHKINNLRSLSNKADLIPSERKNEEAKSDVIGSNKNAS